MAMLKNEACNCPQCNSDETYTIDIEMDIDCLWTKWRCRECDAVWSEYYLLKYDGYAYKGKSYKENGEESD
jgi:transposase-like protein